MTLTWLIAAALLDCAGQPEISVVRFVADYGLDPAALSGYVETVVPPECVAGLASCEVVLTVPLEPGPGDVIYADFYSLDAANNRSGCE